MECQPGQPRFLATDGAALFLLVHFCCCCWYFFCLAVFLPCCRLMRKFLNCAAISFIHKHFSSQGAESQSADGESVTESGS